MATFVKVIPDLHHYLRHNSHRLPTLPQSSNSVPSPDFFKRKVPYLNQALCPGAGDLLLKARPRLLSARKHNPRLIGKHNRLNAVAKFQLV